MVLYNFRANLVIPLWWHEIKVSDMLPIVPKPYFFVLCRCLVASLSLRADHIDYLSKKRSSAIASLRQVRPFISIETALTINWSLISPLSPLFYHCDVDMGYITYLTMLDRLQRLQNLAAIVITPEGYKVRSHDIHSRLRFSAHSHGPSRKRRLNSFTVNDVQWCHH